MTRRIETMYRLAPLSTTDGTVNGTRGEYAISATNSLPTDASDAHFAVADGSYAPPRYLTVKGRLTGDGSADQSVEAYICLWDPDVSEWYLQDTCTIYADNVVTAVGPGAGNVYKLDLDDGAQLAYVHVPTLPDDTELNVVIRGGM